MAPRSAEGVPYCEALVLERNRDMGALDERPSLRVIGGAAWLDVTSMLIVLNSRTVQYRRTVQTGP